MKVQNSASSKRLRPSLGGLRLRLRLQNRLLLEPSQTGVLGAASRVEPLKSRSLERIGGGGARKWWLRPAPRSSPRPFPAQPPSADCRRAQRPLAATGARPSEGGRRGGRPGSGGPRRRQRRAPERGGMPVEDVEQREKEERIRGENGRKINK